MHKRDGDRDILLALAERLPEEVLLELLPGIEPKTIRNLIRSLAAGVPSSGRPKQKNHSGGNSLPPATPYCSLHTDGASRGNPGEAGAGAVLTGPDGAELATRSIYLGKCTNNVAEYQALIAGLELAERSGCDQLHIRLDSELIVRQIQGSYTVRNEQLKPLFEKVKKQLAKLRKWDVRHVRREENIRADELANRGIDSRNEQIGADA